MQQEFTEQGKRRRIEENTSIEPDLASPFGMETTTFDEDGDVALLLDQQPDESYKKRYVVSSKAMSLASPVWKAMFNGKFREGAKSGEVPLPDDDPWALEVMLNFAHLRFAAITEPTIAELVKLTLICDKYDLVALCWFHVDGWVEKYQKAVNDKPEDHPSMAFFAWVFGYAEWMRSLQKALMLRTAFSQTDSLQSITMPPASPGIKRFYTVTTLSKLIKKTPATPNP